MSEKESGKKKEEQPSDAPSKMEEGTAASRAEKGSGKRSKQKQPKQKQPEEGSSATPLYPTPKYVFSIFCPRQITTSKNNIAQQNLIKSRWKSFTFDTASTESNPKKVHVKLSSLIVKMLNRLIKEKMLPREAINILLGESHIFVQILCSSSALPTLMQRCERIGVGNVYVLLVLPIDSSHYLAVLRTHLIFSISVGCCFASPVETALSPSPGPMELFDLSQIAFASDNLVPSGDTTAKTASVTKVISEDDYISSDEEEDDKTSKLSVPSSVGVPFLSEQRKKELTQVRPGNTCLHSVMMYANIRISRTLPENH